MPQTTPPPTVDQEVQRAETMFLNAHSPNINYDHYFKVRDREAAELKLRRDRQLEMLKWSSALLAGLIVAIPNLLTNVPPLQQTSIRLGIGISVFCVLVAACNRILHDSILAKFRADICHAMDICVGYQINDQSLKQSRLRPAQKWIFCSFLCLLGGIVALELWFLPQDKPSSQAGTTTNAELRSEQNSQELTAKPALPPSAILQHGEPTAPASHKATQPD
ncbi:hypothetical protein [Prosthecobacter vanneervenii]|uniref:Transmembrane protein n=1 Tax=Prosthecobacter vanneervenii TaxID=48466 RepID=A0A7W7YDG1_9BACT|nr:hypothetical protein [Prosthecobacter vanneervenii]MBB5034074.1 hypothetical protein [Prosthecobacter vanneervenii]